MQIADEMGLIGTEIFDWSYTTASNVVLVHSIIVTLVFRIPPTTQCYTLNSLFVGMGHKRYLDTTINHVTIKYHLTIKVNWAFYSCILTIVVGWS